jgi:TRAP-type C4-dicarboxylate transport system permease small subunit
MTQGPTLLAKRALLAALALVIHTVLIAVAIGTVYATEKWIHLLWSETDPLLFDRVPYRFLFQAIDCVFIALFGGMGVRDAFHILRGRQ